MPKITQMLLYDTMYLLTYVLHSKQYDSSEPPLEYYFCLYNVFTAVSTLVLFTGMTGTVDNSATCRSYSENTNQNTKQKTILQRRKCLETLHSHTHVFQEKG